MSATVHDRFLHWLSESGTGSLERFREAHAWLFGLNGGPKAERPSWVASRLQSLGHLEVDWENGRWSVTRPCLVGLPSAGATAVLSGSRPAQLVSRLWDVAARDSFEDLDIVEHRNDDAPTAIYVQYGSESTIMAFASAVGIRFERYPAERLARLLSNVNSIVDAGAVTPQPPAGYAVEIFDPRSMRWEPAVPGGDGLYRYRAYYSDLHRFRKDGLFREVDRDMGRWAALSAADVTGLTFQPGQINGTLIAPARVPLPAAFARTAVLCSGLPPHFDSANQTLRYENVPRRLADRIAQALSQNLDS